ncbi:hypothetical protein [Glycomyces xiaoerkulensis]|nr:hypothetical protein [Glycomyces xiaoerkulensis]
MIRTVSGRLSARLRPVYIGRHRRGRPRLAAVLRTAIEPQPGSGGRN